MHAFFLWMSPVFVELEVPEVANGTLPKPLGLCGSTKVGFISIQALYFEILPQTWGESMHGKGIKMIVPTIKFEWLWKYVK